MNGNQILAAHSRGVYKFMGLIMLHNSFSLFCYHAIFKTIVSDVGQLRITSVISSLSVSINSRIVVTNLTDCHVPCRFSNPRDRWMHGRGCMLVQRLSLS